MKNCDREIKKTLVYLLAGGKGQRLYPLTEERAKPAVPFGGKYRIIDFALSNCVNSGFRKILVVTQYKSASLSRHLAVGWNFLSSTFGEYIMDLPPQQRFGEKWYVGTADAVYQNLYFIDREKPEYIIILSGDHIYQMDYRDMLRAHIERKADITVGTVVVEKQKATAFGVMQIDSEERIINFYEKPKDPPEIPNKKGYSLASMGIYVFNANKLKSLLDHDAEINTSTHDFGRDIIPFAIHNKLNVFAYRFVDKNGNERYWRDVGTIDAFYDANMDLIAPIPHLNLYDRDWPIYTHARQYPPVKFASAKVDGKYINGTAINSLLGDGTIIVGAKIEHSVIFPAVKILENTEITDSIIFNDCHVGKNVRLHRVIVDKLVEIPDGVEIGYDLEHDRKYFYVSKNGIVVIPRAYKFPKNFKN